MSRRTLQEFGWIVAFLVLLLIAVGATGLTLLATVAAAVAGDWGWVIWLLVNAAGFGFEVWMLVAWVLPECISDWRDARSADLYRKTWRMERPKDRIKS